jgi:hypothetical protein
MSNKEKQRNEDSSKSEVVAYCDKSGIEAAKRYYHERGYLLVSLSKYRSQKSAIPTPFFSSSGEVAPKKRKKFLLYRSLKFKQDLDASTFHEVNANVDQLVLLGRCLARIERESKVASWRLHHLKVGFFVFGFFYYSLLAALIALTVWLAEPVLGIPYEIVGYSSAS